MIGETLRVYYVFGDPVDNPKLRQDGAMDGLKYGQVYNPIVGYYGETRVDSEGNPKKHTGFDYAVSEGSPVKTVQEGTITRVRFGRWGGDKACAIRTWIKEKGSQAAQNLCTALFQEPCPAAASVSAKATHCRNQKNIFAFKKPTVFLNKLLYDKRDIAEVYRVCQDKFV